MLPGWALVTWIIFWLPDNFVGSLSWGWQESRHCVRARAKALPLPHSFENGEEQFACAGGNQSLPRLPPLHHCTSLLLWLSHPLWAHLTELVLWVCNNSLQKLPELTLAQASASAQPSGSEAFLVLEQPPPAEMRSESPTWNPTQSWSGTAREFPGNRHESPS